MKRNFVDYHSHLLPGIDDGAVDRDHSLEMARILADFGFATVHCTPHLITGGFDNPPERVREATDSLRQSLDEAGIPLRLVPGTEHYLDEFLTDKVPGALTVGGSRYLLVEVPFRSGAEILPDMVTQLRRHRLFPLFAHPERCQAFQAPAPEEGMRGALSFILGRRKVPDFRETPTFLLRESGCRFQGNLGSFAGVYGKVVQQRAVWFLRHGLYACLGSDAHTSQGLANILAAGFKVVAATIGEAAALELLEGKYFDSAA